TAQRRFLVLLVTFFAATALCLSAIGLYGLVAYSVSRCTHEIGIRMALGANRSNVLRLIMGQGLKLILIGVVFGAAASVWLNRLLEESLFEVPPTDATTLTFVPSLLIVVAMLASYMPARRATKVDPMVALRHE